MGALFEHKAEQHGHRSYGCPQCSYRGSSERVVANHLRITHGHRAVDLSKICVVEPIQGGTRVQFSSPPATGPAENPMAGPALPVQDPFGLPPPIQRRWSGSEGYPRGPAGRGRPFGTARPMGMVRTPGPSRWREAGWRPLPPTAAAGSAAQLEEMTTTEEQPEERQSNLVVANKRPPPPGTQGEATSSSGGGDRPHVSLPLQSVPGGPDV